jgi:hypothetical protein
MWQCAACPGPSHTSAGSSRVVWCIIQTLPRAAQWRSRGPRYTAPSLEYRSLYWKCEAIQNTTDDTIMSILHGRQHQSKPGCFQNCRHNIRLLWNNNNSYTFCTSWNYGNLCVHLKCSSSNPQDALKRMLQSQSRKVLNWVLQMKSLETASNDVYIAQHKADTKPNQHGHQECSILAFGRYKSQPRHWLWWLGVFTVPPHRCSDNSWTQAMTNFFQTLSNCSLMIVMFFSSTYITTVQEALPHISSAFREWNSTGHTYLALCSFRLLWASLCHFWGHYEAVLYSLQRHLQIQAAYGVAGHGLQADHFTVWQQNTHYLKWNVPVLMKATSPLKSIVFCAVMPRSLETTKQFEGAYSLHLQLKQWAKRELCGSRCKSLVSCFAYCGTTCDMLVQNDMTLVCKTRTSQALLWEPPSSRYSSQNMLLDWQSDLDLVVMAV